MGMMDELANLFRTGGKSADGPGLDGVTPIGRWGRRPTYSAKVGTRGSTVVLVKRVRSFFVGQRIEYCETSDLCGMSVACTPTWRKGIVYRIDGNRLFIECY